MKALGKGSVASIVEIGLAIAWWLLWIALGGLTLVAFGYGALHAMIAAGWIDAEILGGELDLTKGATGAAWPVVVPALVIGAIVIMGGLIIVGRLRRLFHNFTSGEPFRRENATHLRVIWITMLVVEVARYVLLGAIAALFAAVDLPDGAKADFSFNIDISTWMSIAILIVLAEVFREGARMKEEQELTI